MTDTPLPEATKVPCVQCPWLRTSAPGWLGPHDPATWLDIVHGESPIACHLTIDHDGQPWDQVRQCAGAAIFRANIWKLPHNPNIARGPRDTDTVFAWNDEFTDHHTRSNT